LQAGVKGLNQEVWGQSDGQSKDTLTRGICNVPNGLGLNQSDSRVWSPTNWTTSRLFETGGIHIMASSSVKKPNTSLAFA
jgi:hypothetical protein